MNTSEITDQILGAWDEVSDEAEGETQEVSAVPEPEENEVEQPVDEPEADEDEETEDEEAEEGESDEEEVDEEEEAEADEGEEEGEEEEEVVSYQSDDVEVKAFLAKYNNDLDAALKGAAELYHLINRQGQEKNAALARVAELETELERSRLIGSTGIMLNEQQRAWVETATESGNPGAYVQNAIEAGEFDLARAVCHEWAREDPYSATRAGQRVDQIESQLANHREPVNMPLLLDELAKQFPDMPAFTNEMTTLLSTLGDGHWAVQAARSDDVAAAAQGIVHIYEIAKTTKVNTRSARDKVKRDQREAGASARRKAVVSSGSASLSSVEPPRTVRLGPGLTLEQLEAEFAK